MLARLSPRDRRTLLGGVGAIAAIVALGRGLPAWRRWDAETRAGAAELVAEAARAEASVRDERPTRDSLAARNGRFLALAPRLLEGATPATAAANLSAVVSGVATLSNVRVESVELQSDSGGAGSFRRVAVRASLVGDVRGVMATLAALERGPTLLAIRELAITQTEQAGPEDRAEVLRAQLVVEGLALAPRAAGRGERSP